MRSSDTKEADGDADINEQAQIGDGMAAAVTLDPESQD